MDEEEFADRVSDELGADEELRQGAAAALERESDEDVRAEWRRVSG